MNTVKKYIKTDKKNIYFIRFIFEAYDGIAILETLDVKKGLLVLHIAIGCEKEVDAVLNDISKNIKIETIKSLYENLI